MTRDDFNVALMSLNVLRGHPDDLEPFWEVFQHADAESFRRGCQLALRTRAFFPAPAELFTDCETAAPRETWRLDVPEPEPTGQTAHIANPFGGPGITVQVTRDWKSYCPHCADTGWAPAPSRQVSAYTYDYVAKCACWDGNPALHRKRDAMAQAAASRTHKARE